MIKTNIVFNFIKDFSNCRIILILNLMERSSRDDIRKLTQKNKVIIKN